MSEPRYEIAIGRPGWGIPGAFYVYGDDGDYYALGSIEQVERLVAAKESRVAAMRAALDRWKAEHPTPASHSVASGETE